MTVDALVASSPQLRKRRMAKYVQPRGVGLLFWLAVLACGVWGANALGWLGKGADQVAKMQSDQASVVPLVGVWDIVGVKPTKQGAKPVLGSKGFRSGRIEFDDQGRAEMKLSYEGKTRTFFARAAWDGNSVQMTDLRAMVKEGGVATPTGRAFTMTPDTTEGEAVVLDLLGRERMVLRKTSGSADIPSTAFAEVKGKKIDLPSDYKEVLNRMEAELKQEEE